MRLDIIAGARPNFMKIAPIIKALEHRKALGGALDYRLVHTGQHYDEKMSGLFFKQLGIPHPHVNLEVGSGTHSAQTGAIMVGYETLLMKERSDLCLVVGDVTSTMACAITAQKLHVPVAHVEAGIRSGDWTMPEEINRLVTDAISNWFFTTSETATATLVNSGIDEACVFFVGNTMIDTLLANVRNFKKPSVFETLNLAEKNYFVATLHRPSNVDHATQFSLLLQEISAGAQDRPVVFPVHPRTRQSLMQLPGIPGNIHVIEPQPYLEFNYLVANAAGVLTDSGGITEETTVLGVPCLTLRDSTERPETVSIGTNELIGQNPGAIQEALGKIVAGQWKKGGIPDRWDGHAASRIVDILERLLDKSGAPGAAKG